MKKTLTVAALALGIMNTAFATPKTGDTFLGEGKIIDDPGIIVYQNQLAQNMRIERHNYSSPEATLYFTVTKGKVDVLLNDTELHQMEPGTILRYKGKDFVQSTAQEDSTILVTIIPFD